MDAKPYEKDTKKRKEKEQNAGKWSYQLCLEKES